MTYLRYHTPAFYLVGRPHIIGDAGIFHRNTAERKTKNAHVLYVFLLSFWITYKIREILINMNFDNTSINSADDELIKNLQQNNAAKRKAEEELFNRHAYFIKEGMSRYSLPEEEAFDAYSDTVLQAIDNIVKGLFEKRASLKTYLYRIFNNKCVDLIRKKSTNKSSIHQTMPISDMLAMIADSAKTVIQQLIDKTDLDILKNKMKELGESCRKLLAMFADGYNDKEIALSMEYKTADVVKTSRLRCLEKLRQLYTNKKD